MAIDWKSVKKIAVLNFITVTVGDSLYLLPVVQRLKREAPQAELVLTGSAVTKLVLGNEPSVTRYITVPTEALAQPFEASNLLVKLIGRFSIIPNLTICQLVLHPTK